MKTIVWIVKRGAEYQVIGLGGNSAAVGREAFKAAQNGDLQAARQWLDWLREDQAATSGTDPLAGMAFTRLWPVADAGLKEAVTAAASLAARGLLSDSALTVLVDAQKQAGGGPNRNSIDLALVRGYMVHIVKALETAPPGSYPTPRNLTRFGDRFQRSRHRAGILRSIGGSHKVGG